MPVVFQIWSVVNETWSNWLLPKLLTSAFLSKVQLLHLLLILMFLSIYIIEAVQVHYEKLEIETKNAKEVNNAYVQLGMSIGSMLVHAQPSRPFSLCIDTYKFLIKIRCHCLLFHSMLFSIINLHLSFPVNFYNI